VSEEPVKKDDKSARVAIVLLAMMGFVVGAIGFWIASVFSGGSFIQSLTRLWPFLLTLGLAAVSLLLMNRDRLDQALVCAILAPVSLPFTILIAF
jgi:hypothetical protein